jgi:uroporphyrinogen decarboxylase
MEPAALKATYGDRITFWGGGCDTQQVLPYGSQKGVRSCVRKRFTEFSHNGGYVFQQIHNIMPEVPSENIVAMFDELNTLRFKQ